MEKSKNAGTSLSVPSDILGSYEELRWIEPHTSSPSPCWINDQEAQEKRCLKFYICSDVPHTHTRPDKQGWQLMSGLWSENEDEREMKMRWKLLNRDTRRGTQKRRGGTKREHQHQHTWPGAGEPWKGKGKEKRRPTETNQDQRRGGEDGRAWTNLPERNLSLPKHARTQNLPGKGSTHELGDQWGPSWWKQKPKPKEGIQFHHEPTESCVIPSKGPWSINPNWACNSFRIFTN